MSTQVSNGINANASTGPTLGRLLDRSTLAAELGVTRATVDRIFRELPTVQLPGFRREWVRERDVEALLERHTRVES